MSVCVCASMDACLHDGAAYVRDPSLKPFVLNDQFSLWSYTTARHTFSVPGNFGEDKNARAED